MRASACHRTDEIAVSFVPEWAKDAIFYQIFPDRFANGDLSNDPPNVVPWGSTPTAHNHFGGDLRGILDRLDYISLLGVNCLYLNPIFWSNSNHKYHARDYFKIDPQFGDEHIFRRLVDACHARGIRLLLDAVFNHTGVDFFAFEHVKRNGKQSQYVHWFNIYSFPVQGPSTPNYECWWNLGDLPKLMTHRPEVRQYLFEVTEYWMRFGIDGWRLDVPNEIPHPFWIEWRKLVKRLNPDAYIVGEIWDDGSPWLRGDQFDAVMNYRFRRSCIDFFAERRTTPSEFDRSLAHTRALYPDEVQFVLQNLLGSHDTERFLTVCKGNKDALMLAWLFQMTYIGAPLIYYGDEVGMAGGKDPDCRRTMIWDEEQQDRRLLTTMKSLISLRHRYEVLRRGSVRTVLVDDKRGLYGYLREQTDRHARLLVVLNNSAEDQRIDIGEVAELPRGVWKSVWHTTPRTSAVASPIAGKLDLAKTSGVVLLQGKQL